MFPLADYWWMYLAFTGLMCVLLGIDLTFHRGMHTISLRQAGLWLAMWVVLALVFGYALYLFASATHSPAVGRQLFLEYLAGYVVEESLSVDNMFVFALVFRYFSVPSQLQHRVLFYGILGAMVFRAIFIAGGAVLIRFELVTILFGAFLILTGIRMAFEKEKRIDPGSSAVVRFARRFLPVTQELHDGRFLVRLNGVLHMTPLLVVLLFLEATDILFAVDSVPAVFGVTSEPFVVYTSNVFAILGLRSMFFLLSGALDRFHLLKHGLAVILVFVGLKMVWLDHLFGERFPIGISLIIICSVIALSIILSLAFPKPAEHAAPRRLITVARYTVAGVFLVLAVLDLAYATGLGHSLHAIPALTSVGPVALWVSAACYVLCAAIVLRGGNGTGGQSA